jgi:hypothetical protein
MREWIGLVKGHFQLSNKLNGRKTAMCFILGSVVKFGGLGWNLTSYPSIGSGKEIIGGL